MEGVVLNSRMARMYSRKKGRSGSVKPIQERKHVWVTYDIKTVEQLVEKLSKSGKSASEIGIVLRDSYGIPDVNKVAKKSISKIIIDKGLKKEIPDDLRALIKRDIAIIKHREVNKKDMPAKRGQQLTESKINRLARYYKRKGILTEDWKYSSEEASKWVMS
tara:strand:+ start:62 stop:547 length:486 start_codon:yes stop_codon:yes gene_type:complete